MTLSQKIAAALDAGAAASDIFADDGVNRLSLQLTAADPVGVGLSFGGLEFATTKRADWSPDDLKAWGDRIASRVTYLMEPLVVVEVDRAGGEVELRSKKPTERAQLRSYYEIRLRHEGRLNFARIAFDEATRRRQTADCHMTREAFERLADDLVASVG